MIVGRKKKKENAHMEENENHSDFFKNKSLLEYQNKCLSTLIEDLKTTIEEKSHHSSCQEKQIEALAQVFSSISLVIYNLNETAITVASSLKIPHADNLSLLSTPVKILSNIIKDLTLQTDNVNLTLINDEMLRSLIRTISSNIINLINGLLNIITHENELKSQIESGLRGKLQEKFTKEYDNLKLNNEELKKNYLDLLEGGKRDMRELQSLKVKMTLLEAHLKNKENKVEELEKKNFNLMRRDNANPALPYINFEKKMFNKLIEVHQCICHICGEGINTKQANDVAMENTNSENIIMENTDIGNVNYSNSPINNETINTLQIENERLAERISQLHETLERNKVEYVITEDKLISSKPFKLLMSQAEALLTLIDGLKEANFELHRQKNEIQKENENEIKMTEHRCGEKIHELEKMLLEQRTVLERTKVAQSNSCIQIQSLENELKFKKNEDVNLIFANFENEKENMMKGMETIKFQMKSYEMKFNEEFKKNRLYEDKIEKLEQLNQSATVSAVSENKDSYSTLERRVHKRTEEIRRLENELKLEKCYKDTFISELEVNEKGLNELNKRIKHLSSQLQDCNDKIAKMTNEKIKDMDTIKRMNEEKDSLDGLIKGLEERIKLEYELRNKMTLDINNYKEILNRLDQENKFKEEEIEVIKNETLKVSLLSEQNRMSYEKCLLVIKELESGIGKSASNYELLRIKFEEVCRSKSIDPTRIDKSISSLEKDIEGLKATESKYKNMLTCNVCKERKKDTINLKCFHMVCKICMDDSLKNRNRVCPVCMAKHNGQADLHPIFWD